MSSQGKPPPTLRRAVALTTASSLLVPMAGVLSQPILAQALGVEGRGALAAAMAPAALAISVATVGLPEALTFYLAKYPQVTRRAICSAGLMSLVVGLACFGISLLSLPFLSGGDDRLGHLILIAMAITVPALLVGVARGAAMGRQMWTAVALERIASSGPRLVVFFVLWLTGDLDVVIAVILTALSPLISGFVYWRLLRRPTNVESVPVNGRITTLMLSYGMRTWLGAVASMLVARIGQILMVPLSSVEDLGLYSVAVTIADLPLIVAVTVQSTLFGVNSRASDSDKLTATARLTLLLGIVGCGIMAGTLPLWLVPLFGAEFADALLPTVLLLLSAIICIPGLLAASGVAAWGRPGLRSLGLALTLVANLATFVWLVPYYGVIGACITSIVSNVVMSGFMVVAASRVMRVPTSDFIALRGKDIWRAWQEIARLVCFLRRIVRPTSGG